jgi:hypothetical protein
MPTRIRLAGVPQAVLLEDDADAVAEAINATDLDVALVEFRKYRVHGLAAGTVFIAPAHVASVESYDGSAG